MKILIIIIFITTFIFNAFGQDFSKPEADKIYQLLEKSDSRGTFEYLADLFERNGANVFIGAKSYPALQLKLKDVTEVINDFSGMENTIEVSRMPNFDESRIYWENWSKVLAKGNFDYQKFFRDDRERFLLANFNSLVLMSHEYGHYFGNHYQFYHSAADKPLNCGEYFADKFAVAVINHLAQDERFAKIRTRYIELIKNFDQSLPKENQLKIPSYELLKSDCSLVKMEGNGVNSDGSLNYDFFRTYASAYFNRHQLMLADDKYPGLAQVIENDLTKPFEPKKYNLSDEKVLMRTIKEVKTDFVKKDFDYGFQEVLRKEPNSPKLNQASQVRSALNHKGEILHARANFQGKNAVWENLAIEVFDAEQKNVDEKFSAKLPKDLQKHTFLHSFLAIDDNLIVLFFGTYDDSSNCSKSFAKAEKQNGAWQIKFSKKDVLKKLCETNGEIFVTPSGKIRIINALHKKMQKVDGKMASTSTLNEFSLDFEAMKPKEKRLFFIFIGGVRFAGEIFGNDQNRVFLADYSLIFELKDQSPFLIGNKLLGIKDGRDKDKISFFDIVAIRWIGEKRIVFVDKLDDEKSLVREIVLE